MNIGRTPLIIFLVAVFEVGNAFAKSAPTLPNSYDGFAPSARSMAMGSAGVGLAGADRDSFFYNPAGVADFQGSFLSANLIFLRTSNASPAEVALYDPSGQGLTSAYFVKDSGSFFWQALSDNVVLTDNSRSQISIGRIGFSVSKKGSNGISQGITLSYLYGKIGYTYDDPVAGNQADIISGNGFALDYSFLFPVSKNLNFGISLKNILAFMFWNNGYNAEQLPLTSIAGFGYNDKGFSAALDWNKKYYRFGDLKEDSVNIGLEQYLTDFLCVRAGIESDLDFIFDDMTYTCGLGFKIKKIQIDIAGQREKILNQDSYKAAVSVSAGM